MTAVAPLLFPGSRVVAGWWKHLTALQPRRLWVGHLLLHRVEALVALKTTAQLEPWLLLVLKALALAPEQSREQVNQRLHLGVPMVSQVLRHLEAEQLVHLVPGDFWSLTPLGHQCLDQGKYPRREE